ncbi:MAG: RloB domain-containing protein [Pyrinomonadaceae bacterium]|nr:RloB domain-containing protein [Pyrinomonadaceae bacterium]
MRITIFSESSADEAALKILVEGILGEKVEEEPRKNKLRSRGFASVENELPVVIKSTYYNTDADSLIVVYDSDDEPVHEKKHYGNEAEKCRLCFLQRKISEVVKSLKPRPERNSLKIAFGVAVPAIEAWYLCGTKIPVGEESWKRKLKGEKVGYDRTSLKEEIYGVRPFRQKQIETAIKEAKKLAQNLELLEEKFPEGFSIFANEIRSWKQ